MEPPPRPPAAPLLVIQTISGVLFPSSWALKFGFHLSGYGREKCLISLGYGDFKWPKIWGGGFHGRLPKHLLPNVGRTWGNACLFLPPLCAPA